MAVINYTLSDAFNFEQPEEFEGETLNESFQLPSIFGNKSNTSYRLDFTVEGGFGADGVISNTAVTSTPDYIDVTILDDDSIRVSINASPFEETYSFTSLTTLRSGNTAQETVDIGDIDSYNLDGKILTSWDIPEDPIANREQAVTAVISLAFETSVGQATRNYQQKLYWDYNEGYEKFKTIQDSTTIEQTQDYDFENPDTSSADAISDSLSGDRYAFDESRIDNQED